MNATAERTTMNLRFEPGTYVPRTGDTVVMKGMCAWYAVTIHRVKRAQLHPTDGATLLDVTATKRAIANMSVQSDGADEALAPTEAIAQEAPVPMEVEYGFTY